MKSLDLQLEVVKHQASLLQVPHVQRDLDTLRRRYAGEGEYFLEVLLPELDDALLVLLSKGFFPYVSDFSTDPNKGTPLLFSGWWDLLVDDEGYLVEEPRADVIRSLRQILRLRKKIFEVCPSVEVDAAIAAFRDYDRELDHALNAAQLDRLRRVFDILYGWELNRFDWTGIKPKHGPGAVAERLRGPAKFDFGRFSAKVESVWPGMQTPLASYTLTDGGLPMSRLAAVPKTRLKPRLIAIEPAAHQYAQQGMLAAVTPIINRVPISNLSSQEPNKLLAQECSRTGSGVTVDLSNASDSVLWTLVEDVMRGSSRFLEALRACRTDTVEMPDGDIHHLRAFATMGNAMTFPVQVMLYTSFTVLAVLSVSGEQLTTENVWRVGRDSGSARVYGDDIIVPTPAYSYLLAILEYSGFQVNGTKTFSDGLFRESCGGDFYQGEDVTPVYARRPMPRSREDSTEIVSLVALANLYYAKYGPSPIMGWVRDFLRDEVGVAIPFNRDAMTRSYLCLEGFPSWGGRRRYNEGLQRHEVHVPVAKMAKEPPSAASDGARLCHAISVARGGIIEWQDFAKSQLVTVASVDEDINAESFITKRWEQDTF